MMKETTENFRSAIEENQEKTKQILEQMPDLKRLTLERDQIQKT